MPTEVTGPAEGRVRLYAAYPDRPAAEEAVIRLEKLGIPTTAISMIIGHESGRVETTTAERAGQTFTETVKTGSVIGGAMGATLGAIAAAAALVTIPGAIILGPIAGAIIGAGAGGVTGGVIGTLAAEGVPHELAEDYQQIVSRGGVVVLTDAPLHLEEEARRALTAPTLAPD